MSVAEHEPAVAADGVAAGFGAGGSADRRGIRLARAATAAAAVAAAAAAESSPAAGEAVVDTAVVDTGPPAGPVQLTTSSSATAAARHRSPQTDGRVLGRRTIPPKQLLNPRRRNVDDFRKTATGLSTFGAPFTYLDRHITNSSYLLGG